MGKTRNKNIDKKVLKKNTAPSQKKQTSQKNTINQKISKWKN